MAFSPLSTFPIVLLAGCVVCVVIFVIALFFALNKPKKPMLPWKRPSMPDFQNYEIRLALEDMYNVYSNCSEFVAFITDGGDGAKILMQMDAGLTALKDKSKSVAKRKELVTYWMIIFFGAFIDALEKCPSGTVVKTLSGLDTMDTQAYVKMLRTIGWANVVDNITT